MFNLHNIFSYYPTNRPYFTCVKDIKEVKNTGEKITL